MLSSSEATRRLLDGVDAVADVLDVLTQFRAGFDGEHVRLPQPVPVPWGESRDGQFEVFGGFDVGEGVEHLQQFGDVLELREPALEFEPVTAGDGEFHFFDDLAERRGPGVEVLDPGSLEQVRAQVALHDVHFRDGVRDRCCRGTGDHAPSLAFAQELGLHVQVRCPVGSLDCGAGDVGRCPEVLVVVQLVHDEVVNAGFLEADPGVGGSVEFGFEAFLPGPGLPFPAV